MSVEPTPSAAPEPIAVADPVADPAAPTTILNSDPAPVADPAPSDAPDWRAKFAGEDAAFRKQLDRFSDEAAFAKSYRAMQQKMSSGELKRALPEKPTEDELKAWRKDNGIPDKPEAYVEALKLPNGVVPGEADKPLLDGFAKHAMDKNWTPAQYNDAVQWYYGNLDAQKAAQEEADGKFKSESEDALRNAWQGPDYRANLTAVNNMLSLWPEEVKVALLASRDPTGRKLGDNAAFVKQLAELAREINPMASLPATVSDHGKGLDIRINELNALIADRRSDYYRGPNAAKLQTEYRELLDVQSRMKTRAA